MSGLGTDERTRLLQRSMQAVVLVVLVAGLVLVNVGVVVNAALALAVTELPTALRRDHDVFLGPWVTLWITAAVMLHALGMVVLYEAVPWWDHLTHLVSAALVAGVSYATVRAVDAHASGVHFPSPYLGLFVVLFTLAAGVTWETLEMVGRELARAVGAEPVLIVYGLDDTMLDLVFDGLGGLAVALLGGPHLAGLTERLRRRLDEARS